LSPLTSDGATSQYLNGSNTQKKEKQEERESTQASSHLLLLHLTNVSKCQWKMTLVQII
jgi:hypothetical protein